MSDDPNEKDGIYKVQTVPPPDGSADVYNAPTKVGPMATSVIQELIEQAQRTGGVVEARQAGTAPDRPTPVNAIEPQDLEEIKPPPPPPVPAKAKPEAPSEKPMEKLDSAELADLVSQEAAALSEADRASVPRTPSSPTRAAATPEAPPLIEPTPFVATTDVAPVATTTQSTSDAPITNAELGRNPHQRLIVIGAVLLAVIIMVWFVAAKLMP